MDSATMSEPNTKKIGMINCEDAEKWGNEVGSCKLLIEIYAEKSSLPVDLFVPIHAITGKLPKLEELPDYAGFLIAGSHYSACDNSEWMLRLEEFVRMCKRFYDEADSHGKAADAPRLLGVCFGHQLICKALGGTVGKNPLGRFVFGAETIKPSLKFLKRSFTQPLRKNGTVTFNVLQTHGDSVLSLPAGGEVLASSASCEYEMVQYGNTAVSVQGHPDLTVDLMVERILPSLESNNVLSEEETKKSFESFELKTNEKEIVDALFYFMYHGSVEK